MQVVKGYVISRMVEQSGLFSKSKWKDQRETPHCSTQVLIRQLKMFDLVGMDTVCKIEH
jgi:hypothetical protein